MKDIICWWSGGITSAVACRIAIDIYGVDRCRVFFLDTKNEHEDTYRFLKDCEGWYGLPIETLTAIGKDRTHLKHKEYNSIYDVWKRNLSLNVAHGAICSSELKRAVREDWQKNNIYTHQVFGFEFNKREFNRAMSMAMNHPKASPIFPLMMQGLTKEDCINVVETAGIVIPEAYKMGFHNNNCLQTGCVQGGFGYWQKMKIDMPENFERMANVEHELTNLKGRPVTMLRSKQKTDIESGNVLVFLKKHPDYPNLKCIDDFTRQEVKPLTDCNGFCGINDLNERSTTEFEINYEMPQLTLNF